MKISPISLFLLLGGWSIVNGRALDPVDGTRHEVQTRAAGDRGSYTVSGLGSRKQAVLNAGGNTLDLAIAMLETEGMNTNYPYGELIAFVLTNPKQIH